ncbi:uncharacterized protein DUF4391 [Salegentibacter sp. 24]|uniref:DUF4391 domain-containing protein n=1 Tax=Salegentibacter sp. 24 TaxID=2183986 RepID=UPI00105E1E09|nr:DUF4391 domain-containing protein [Salegentibacter sp. 24]TDN95306.1 uncharacterized protein DUF4391 [Salegentibacter sp. 24]
MEFFDLPDKVKVNRVVPKNAFDSFTNSKQKQLFTDLIKRITWSYKLSETTTNLPAKEVKEIQIFYVELKQNEKVQALLDIIDKSIPYPIIFLVNSDEDYYFSTSTKHPHPVNENISVIDWTFNSEWMKEEEMHRYSLPLKKSLDNVYEGFCYQLAGENKTSSLADLVENQEKQATLKTAIDQLQRKIKSSKTQFRDKVELNQELNKKKKELKALLSSTLKTMK